MSNNFQQYSIYYDFLYKDKEYALESAYIDTLVKELDPGAKKVLELGCGTGNHAEFLCRLGYSVTGIEQSLEMVNLAINKNIKGFTPQLGDITRFDLSTQYDAVISLFHVISYLSNNDSLISCFKSVAKNLKEGGLFIFDVWYSPAVHAQVPETRIKRLEDEHAQITRLAEPVIYSNENIVDVSYEIIIKNKESELTHVINETHSMRHFSIPEIDLVARMCGFQIILTEEFLTRKHPGKETWGVCFILKRNE